MGRNGGKERLVSFKNAKRQHLFYIDLTSAAKTNVNWLNKFTILVQSIAIHVHFKAHNLKPYTKSFYLKNPFFGASTLKLMNDTFCSLPI